MSNTKSKSGDAQKDWLLKARAQIAHHMPKATLSWDRFAELAGIESRALKTYRMPESSLDYRTMPANARAAVEALLNAPSAAAQGAPMATPDPRHKKSGLIVPALAALVVRMGRLTLLEGQMISGISRGRASLVGLSPEDRRAMALVSRACLTNGLPDRGAEIHELLAACTKPLGDWLPIPEIVRGGLSATTLIEPERGIPTPETEELAGSFTGLTAGLEEQIFARFKEILNTFPKESAYDYYTRIREFVVRHPLTTTAQLQSLLTSELPVRLIVLMTQEFYEAVPRAWSIGGAVQVCRHCGNAMRRGKASLVCRSAACAASRPSEATPQAPSTGASEMLRTTRGISQYWVDPGIDEVRLYDELTALGIEAQLYPHRDRVDIEIDALGVGIDLKSYASPETLGHHFKRGLGGLEHYEHRWVVIPDWRQQATPSYLDRLRSAMERTDAQCMTVTGVTPAPRISPPPVHAAVCSAGTSTVPP